MKSWIFSHNDQLTPALSGDEALKYVTEHPHAYAWHPSYTHWMPITQIAEFAQVVKAPKAPSVIPKELIEQFIVKEKALVEKLNVLDNKIVHAINALSDFESEVEYHKELTHNCNLDVQETLNNIEQQYARLKANLQNFKQSATTDKREFASVTEEFKKSTSLKSAQEPKAVEESIEKKQSAVTSETPAKSVTAESASISPKKSIASEHTVSEEKNKTEEPSARITESDSLSIGDDSVPNETAESIQEPVDSPVVERVAPKSEAVPSASANKAAASLSELVEDAAPAPTVKPAPRKLARVEFSEDITAEDLAIAAKIQSMTVTEDKPQSYEKPQASAAAEGDFDYILQGKYVDDGSIGARVTQSDNSTDNDELEEELVSDLDEHPKKRRRRKRR